MGKIAGIILSDKGLKVAGLVLSAVGTALGFIGSCVDKKRQDDMIKHEIQEEIAKNNLIQSNKNNLETELES